MLIIRFLSGLFELYYSNDIVNAKNIKIKGVNYFMESNSNDNEGFIGFFDWLRSNDGLIRGIRLCFFEHQAYNGFLIKLPYIKPTFDDKCMELLFEDYPIDASLSGDQDFTHNYVYESDNGEYLFTFGLDHLTKEELNSLLEYSEVLNGIDVRSN